MCIRDRDCDVQMKLLVSYAGVCHLLNNIFLGHLTYYNQQVVYTKLNSKEQITIFANKHFLHTKYFLWSEPLSSWFLLVCTVSVE